MREIDALLAAGRRPIVVGGTGLYLRAALAELDLRPPVPHELRQEVERELAERGAEALHAELDPELARERRSERPQADRAATELARAGIEPARGAEGHVDGGACVTRPLLIGLTMDRERLAERIDARVDEMVAAGAAEEARAAPRRGRLADRPRGARLRAAVSDIERHRRPRRSSRQARTARYARRQLTWMRRMEGVDADRPHGRPAMMCGRGRRALRSRDRAIGSMT